MKKRFYAVSSLLLLVAAAVGWVVWQGVREDPDRVQRLEDGSKFALTRASCNTNAFTHGKGIERLLDNTIPVKGLKLGPVQLQRPFRESFFNYETGGLVIEFKRLTTNAPGLQPTSVKSRRAVRCKIIGDDGSEYQAEYYNTLCMLTSSGLSQNGDDAQYPVQWHFFDSKKPAHRDGEFEYLVAPGLPRESSWLRFQFETFDGNAGEIGRHWQPLADFKIKNPARSRPKLWLPTPTPVTNAIGGFRFLLNDTLVYPQPNGLAHDTDRGVMISLQVQSNGVAQTNWRVLALRLEDALGNVRERGHPFRLSKGWLTQRDPLYLDPQKCWKFEADLAPVPLPPGMQTPQYPDRLAIKGMDPQGLCTITVPRVMTGPLLTNVHGIPLQVTPRGSWVDSKRSLQYEVASGNSGWLVLRPDKLELPLSPGGPAPAQFLVPDNGVGNPELTFALVKTYHVVFLVRPKVTNSAPSEPGGI